MYCSNSGLSVTSKVRLKVNFSYEKGYMCACVCIYIYRERDLDVCTLDDGSVVIG
jgi:hypothetical protein